MMTQMEKILTTTRTWIDKDMSDQYSTKATFLHHTSCEHCHSSDALAHYSDGGLHCFSCGYSKKGGSQWDDFSPTTHVDMEDVDTEITVPHDLGFQYSPEALKWCGQYDIAAAELMQHRVKWSQSKQQLMFVYFRFDENNKVGVTQGRNFKDGATKYENHGFVNNVLPIYWGRSTHTNTIVVVEDALSAIKVARTWDSMALLGSSITTEKLLFLKRKGFRKIIFWLDHDKYEAAMDMKDKCTYLGMMGEVICTDLDPKMYNNREIEERVKAFQ